MVSMDGSVVSKSAFDLACKVATKLDSLYVYHVQTDESTTMMVNEVRLSCDKLLDTKKVVNAAVITAPKTSKSIRDLIEEFIEVKAIDLLFMGSSTSAAIATWSYP